MNFLTVSTCVLLLTTGILADPIKDTTSSGYAKCLDADSISCLQLTLFRQAKSLFESPQIEVFGGVQLLKTNEGRQGKSIDDNAIAIESAPTVSARTSVMTSYLWENAKNFLQERSLSLNFANVARSMSRAIPDDIKDDIKDLVVEGRTKKKLILKKLLPVILGIGAKVAVLAIGSLFGLLLIAKKALFVSVIAFVVAVLAGISGLGRGGSGGLLGGLGGIFGGGSVKSANTAGWSSGGNAGGWSSGGGGAGWDTHGAYSSPVAQTLAYSGYKQARR